MGITINILTNYYIHEKFDYVNDVITREKRIKGWKRKWKLELIKRDNPII